MPSPGGKGAPSTRVPSAPSEAPLRIVAIGGGTGLSTLLQGTKRYAQGPRRGIPVSATPHPTVDITAVVTVTDDGGSSGRLRREFDVLPPGDIRNCMVALSEDEALLSQLFQYRFPSGRGLRGHSFGNLFLAALSQVTGDFARAVKVSSEVLAIAGRIYPSTAANVSLQARLENGKTVVGETNISRSRSRIRRVTLKPQRCSPLEETLDAIADADLITFGPGSLFTSVIPNLLVAGIPAAIRSSSAVKVCIVNLMWQPGETVEFTASDHVRAIHDHARGHLVDKALINTRAPRAALLRKYAKERSLPVKNDLEQLSKMGLSVVSADLLQDSQKVRHDPDALADVIVELALQARRQREGGKRTAQKAAE